MVPMRRGFATVFEVSSLVCRCERHSPAAENSDLRTHHVGFVGGGQLARMAGEAASALGLSVVVLAEDPADAACAVATEVLIGSPRVAADLRALSERCEVITFDHEQVDLTIVADLVAEGVVIRPGPGALELAVDKATMRQALVAVGLPVPAHLIIDPGPDAAAQLVAFGRAHGWPCILKTARGGYDGKGVWTITDASRGRDGGRAAGRGRPIAGRGAGAPRCRAGRHGGAAAQSATAWPGRPSRRPRWAGSAARCWSRDAWALT